VPVEPSAIFAADALAGRVVLITGGGTNLGRQAALECAAAGAWVVVAGRREEPLAAVAAQIGERCSWVAGDIREAEEAARIVRTACDRHDRLDVLVNNAGGQYFVPVEDIALKGWRAVTRLNVEGTDAMTRAAADAGFGAGGGTVVNVTVSPHHGFPAMAHSGAARAAVEALTRELAAAWRERGIALVALALGRFDTESLRKYPDVAQRSAARSVPLGRLGTMREVGWMVARRRPRQLDRPVAADPLVGEGGEVPTEARRR
jgi:citronellol/citronellal dehydrogenase